MKPKKSQAPRRIKGYDTDRLTRQLRTVLGREVERLMDLSFGDKLSKDDTSALITYMKHVKELKKEEENDLDNLTDEQLEALAKGDKA